MTPELLAHAEQVLRSLGSVRETIEFGSYDVNGSFRPIVKSLFPDSTYTGIDIRPGPGVDVVADMTQFPNASADLVICTETLEHVQDWKAAVRTLKAVAQPWLVVSVPKPGCPRHDYPGDYWRWSPAQLISCFLDRKLHAIRETPESTLLVLGAQVILEAEEVR